jgi:photosystem II stability/assembly factor-like uncharacterized protein
MFIKSIRMSKRYIVLVCLAFCFLLVSWLQVPDFTENFDDPDLSGWEHSENSYVLDGVLHIEPFGFAYYPGLWGPQQLELDVRKEGLGDLIVGFSRGDEDGFVVRLGVDFIALFRMQNQDAIELASFPMDFPSGGEWFELTINYSETLIDVTVFDQTVISTALDGQVMPGGLELRVEGDLVGGFDNIRVSLPTVGGEPEDNQPSDDQAEQPELISASQPAYQSGQWVFLGGPSGGLGYDIRMHPDNPDIMFVTDAYAGVFKSVDGGKTWSQSNTGITTRLGAAGDSIPDFCLTIDPNNPDIIWVGTQYSSGVYKSTNGGDTWTSMNTGSNGIQEEFISIRGFSVEPGNSDVVYMAGEISSWEWNGEPLPGLGLDMTKGVIYKSTNGGQTWNQIWYGDNLGRYVWIDPQNTDRLLASTGIFDREAANSDPSSMDPGGVGILRSFDGGMTWEVLDENNGFSTDDLYFGSLYMHPDDSNFLVAAAGNDPYGTPGGIYRTTDGGDNWNKVLELRHASAVEICEGNPNVIYAGSVNGFQRSDDGGDTWVNLAGPRWGPPTIVAGFPIDMQCDSRDSDRIFVNNYGGGNFLSEDAGETWVDSSWGYTGALLTQVAVAQDNSGLVYASARSGVFSSWDGGSTWEGLSSGVARDLEGYFIAVDPFASLHVITGLADTGHVPKETLDGGSTWIDVINPYLVDGTTPLSSLIEAFFHPYVEGMLFFSIGDIKCRFEPFCDLSVGKGLIYSVDGGDSWNQTNITDESVIRMAFYPDGNLIFAGTRSGRLYRSLDSGVSWELIGQNLLPEETFIDPDTPTAIVGGLLVSPDNADLLYAGAGPGGIFISTDGGQSWKASSAGMPPEANIVDLIMDPTNTDVLYAATRDSGVYLSQDGGATWVVFNQGLSMREMRDLTISADGSVVYAATVGAGVFRMGTPEVGVRPAPPTVSEPETTSPEEEVQPEEQDSPPDEPPPVEDQQIDEEEAPAELPTGLLLGVGGGLVLVALVIGFIVGRRKGAQT